MTALSFSSLRLRILLLVSFAVVPALGLTLYAGMEQRRHGADQVQRDAMVLARLAADEQKDVVEATRQLLVTLAQLPPVRGGDPTACDSLLGSLREQYQTYQALGVVRPNGDVLCSAPPLTQPINVADRAYFQRVLQTHAFAVSGYQISRRSGKGGLASAYPILDPTGRVQLVFVAILELTWLNRLAAGVQLPPGSTLTVIDRHGTILVRFPDPETWVGKSVPAAPIVRHVLSKSGEGVTENVGEDGIHRFYAFTPLTVAGMAQGTGTSVYVGIPAEVAFAAPNRLLRRNLALLGLVTALAFGAAWVGGDVFFLRRVDALVTATDRLGTGDLSTRTGLAHVPGELGQLARTFDRMAAGLEQRETERKRAEEEVRSLAKFPSENPNPVLRVSADGKLLYANEASQALQQEWGCAPGDPLPQPWADLVGENLARQTSRTVDIGCGDRTYSFFVAPVPAAGYVNLYGRDVTEQKQAEQALITRTRQLEAVRAVSAEVTRELHLPTLLGQIHRRAS